MSEKRDHEILDLRRAWFVGKRVYGRVGLYFLGGVGLRFVTVAVRSCRKYSLIR
jgi:hypothetical protein